MLLCLREVAIADGVAAVPQGHVLAGTAVLPDPDDHPFHHGQSRLAPRMQVEAVVKPPFPGKRVAAVAVGRRDADMPQRIAHAEITLHPLLFTRLDGRRILCGGRFHRRRPRVLRTGKQQPRPATVRHGSYGSEPRVGRYRADRKAPHHQKQHPFHAAKITPASDGGPKSPYFLPKTWKLSDSEYDFSMKIIF